MQKNNGLFGCGAMRVAAGLSQKRETINILSNGDFHTGDLTGWNDYGGNAVVLLNQPVGGKTLNVIHFQTVNEGYIGSDSGPTEDLFSSVGLNVGDVCNLKLSFWYKSLVATANPTINIAGITPAEEGTHDYLLAPSTGWRFCERILSGVVVSGPQVAILVMGTQLMTLEWFADFKIVRV